MAINLFYGADGGLIAQAGQATGEAKYAQEQERLAIADQLAQQQLAQQGEQFDKRQNLEIQMAALRDQQLRRQMGQQGYQFEAGRADQAAGQQAQFEQQRYLADVQQGGYAEMREQEERQFQTREQNRIKEFYANKEYGTGMASAEAVMKQWPTMNEAQREQAVSQWENRFGQSVGKFPFFEPAQGPPQDEVAQVEEKLRGYYGEGKVTPNMTKAYMEMSGPEQLDYDLRLETLNATKAKAKEDAQIKLQQAEADATLTREIKEMETTQKLETDWANHEQKLLTDKEKNFQTTAAAAEKHRNELAAKVRENKITVATAKMNARMAAIKALEPKDIEARADKIATAFDEEVTGILGEGESMPAAQQPTAQAQQSGKPGSSKENPVSISTPAEIEALPPGTYYKRPDGKVGRRPL